MSGKVSRTLSVTVAIALPLLAADVSAQQLFQPPGVNVTYGDVTHGTRIQSASANPAAAAAELARHGEQAKSGTVISAAAGLEYGNIQELWDWYDDVSQAYQPSDGDVVNTGQLPETKPPGGIDLGKIWDTLDPDIQDELTAVADEVARQAAILALISVEGYGKAWVAANAPVVFAKPRFGGAITLQLSWSGTARGFGVVDQIEFDRDVARAAIQDWFDTEIADRPVNLQVGSQVLLLIDSLGDVRLSMQNDSGIAFKATQLSTLTTGYSRAAWSNDAGTLYVGGEMHLHNMRLSRLAVRFGDITNSEELFDAIRNADFESDTRLSIDAGLLWVGNTYQLGAQLTNLNKPEFAFPAVDTTPFANETIIRLIRRDRTYSMEPQLKLEASLLDEERKLSWHFGLDANSARDPVGSRFQWLTASAGFNSDSRWMNNLRLGYRQNLVGTEKKYLSLGTTLFKFMNIDVASSLESTRVDGRKLPQGLMFNMGFQLNW